MKTELMFVVLVISALIIAGCSSGNTSALDRLPFSPNATVDEIQLYMETAAANDDVGMCLKIPNEMPTCIWTSACIAGVAVHKMDAGICNRITACQDADEFDISDYAKDSCRGDVELAKVSDVALKGGSDACLKLSGTFERNGYDVSKKTVCLMQAAINKTDYRICELMDDSETLDACLFNVIDTENPENKPLCQKIQGTDLRDVCIRMFKE